MIFGKKCSLCGGKLGRNDICTECGLDNKKSEKYYRINQSSCDDLPLTHVHEELLSPQQYDHDRGRRVQPKKQPKVQPKVQPRVKQPVYQTGMNKEKSGKGCLTVILVIFFIGIIVPIIFGLIDGLTSGGILDNSYEYEVTERISPYEYVGHELPEEGEAATYTLTSGEYIVGVHIPAGNYWAEVQDDYDTVQVHDYENSIYLYEYLADELNYLDDIRLYPGAHVTIYSAGGIKLNTENAQITELVLEENPVKDGYRVEKSSEVTAGVDFEPGVYNIQAIGDYGVVEITVYDENENVWEIKTLFLGEDSEHGLSYSNLVIPEGAQLCCDEGVSIVLVPSEIISDTNYLDYYM